MCSVETPKPSDPSCSTSQHTSKNYSPTKSYPVKPLVLSRLFLDMKKVAKMDDTVLKAHEDFSSDDCRSADEFKARILNTNLIINKQQTAGNFF